MSEEKSEYAIVQPKKIETIISGFVPLFDYVMDFYKDPITALVFGRRWQYCGMEDGVCRASLAKIASDLHISEATVMRHTDKLVADGFLIDTTPNLRNHPHVYIDGGLVEMKNYINAGVSERNTKKAGIAERNTSISQGSTGIAESQLIKQDNTKIKQKSPFLSERDIEEVNAQVDYIIASQSKNNGADWRGRELVPPHLMKYADWWHKVSNQVMQDKINKDWFKAFDEWYKNDVSVGALQEAYDVDITWKKVIAKPHEVTAKAIAINALPKPQQKENNGKAFYA